MNFIQRLLSLAPRPSNDGAAPHSGTVAQPFFYSNYRLKRRRYRSRMTRAYRKGAKRVAAGF